MKKTIAILLCLVVLMPFAYAECIDASQIKLTMLEIFTYEDDSDNQSIRLYIAYEGPQSCGWDIAHSAGESFDYPGSQYNAVSWPMQEGQQHKIFHIKLPSAADDYTMVLKFKDDSGNTNALTFPLAEIDGPVSPEARSEYGIYDFGNFVGYITEAFIKTEKPSVELQIRIQPLLFSDTPDYRFFTNDDFYTNAAEQFKFYAKDGTPLNEALGSGEYEIEESFGSITFRCSVQSGGTFDSESVKKKMAETFGYIEYTHDNGETIRPYIQRTGYYLGNATYVEVDTQMP